MKKKFYTEAAYLLGLIIIAFSAALMTRADFGLSMVVAPAYILHLKISETFAFFSFGMAEYTLQAVLLILMILILRRFRLYYLFSFVTAVFYGFLLDGALAIVNAVPVPDTIFFRILFYVLGLACCAIGVAVIFHTYIAPEVYELFVKEVAPAAKMSAGNFKTLYDCVSCLIAILLSFLFFGLGHFEGVGPGTIVCALVNGQLIGICTKWLDDHFIFKDALDLHRYFIE